MPDLIKIDSKAAQARLDDAERVPIFEVDGTVYTVAKVERADVGLEYVERVDRDGIERANAWAIKATVGQEGFDALRGVAGLAPEDWQGVMDAIEAVITPKAQSPLKV